MTTFAKRQRAIATDAPELSVVVPFLDEATNLPVLIAQLKVVLDRLDRSAEVVLVDDGSTDGSSAVAAAAIGGDPRFHVLRLRDNFGKSSAVAAGRDHSSGDVVLTMDADMQDPPEAIPRFLEQIDAGSDLVAGWRLDRSAPCHRRVYSAVFNAVVRVCTGIAIHDMNCGMKAYRRSVLDAMYLSPGMHRFTPILAHGNGYRVSELQVPNRERLSGRTKFGAGRYFEAAIGLVGALYVRSPARTPLMSFGAAGAVLVALALAGACVHAAWGPEETGASFAVLAGVALVFLLGVVLMASALIGELILHRLPRTSHRALYELHDSHDPR